MTASHNDMTRHARAFLLRTDLGTDPKMVEDYLSSSHFRRFINVCNTNLAEEFRKFAASGTPTDTETLTGEAVDHAPPADPQTAQEKAQFLDLTKPLEQQSRPALSTETIAPAKPTDAAAEAARAADNMHPAGDVPSSMSVASPLAAPAHESAQATGSTAPEKSQPAQCGLQTTTSGPKPINPAARTNPSDILSPKVVLPNLSFRLANARVGDQYEHNIAPQGLDALEIMFLEIVIPDGLGLGANLQTGAISGLPVRAGDYTIQIHYCYKVEGRTRPRKAEAPLLVNADPKSLWKDLPSDKADIFWKEDAACESLKGSDFCIVAASKRGRSHAHVGGFRDDDFFVRHVDQTGWHIAIVADGAGSAKYSRRGAKLVCDEAGKKLTATLSGPEGEAVEVAAAAYHRAKSEDAEPKLLETARQSLRNALFVTVGHAAFHAVKAIQETVAARTDLQATYKDFSTTALISASRRFPFGTLCVAYWVGDGAVGIYSRERGITLLGDVDSGEFSGQTRFLDSSEVTQEALLRRTRFELVDDLTALILMTDGVTDPKFETEANLARGNLWHALWADLEQSVGLSDKAEGMEQRLLSWLDFWSQGNHDDRTIAIVY